MSFSTLSFIFLAATLVLASAGTAATTTTYATTGAGGEDEWNRTIFMWHQALCNSVTSCNNMRDITQESSGFFRDLLIMHYGPGHTPTQTQITAMEQVTDIIDGRKGMEFVSLAELEQYAPLIAQHFPGGILGYNLEGHSPDSEEAAPIASTQAAKAIAQEHGLKLWMAPSVTIMNSANIDNIANIAGFTHLQVQGSQDDDATCTALKNKVVERVQFIQASHPDKDTFLSYQLSLTQNAASGKTIVETITDCMDATTPTDVDGASVWTGQAGVGYPDQGPTSDWAEVTNYHNDNF